jgi:asparagine synthase (glutamine-hydrolysing)
LIEKDHVAWSSVLDPLVLFAGKNFVLDEEYVAGWFTYFPAVHLTPYVGVHSVPPSSFVLLRPGSRIIRKYWNFDPGKQIRYRSDAEYEEHFRSVLATAVRRRLRSDRPILAELSGGMDSSSIVCMADLVIAGNTSELPCLDTISWYDDSNPDLDERTYFTKVEEKRGRPGYHIDLGEVSKAEGWETNSERSVTSEFGNDHFRSTPFLTAWHSERFQQHAAYLVSHGHRVTLSGIGGGEVTGDGVPSPTPELQDLLAGTRFVAFAKQVKAWAVKMRKSRVPLFWEAARGFLPPALGGLPTEVHKAPWFNSRFVRRNHLALSSYPSRVKLFGALPSFQNNLLTLELTQRVLAYLGLQSEMLCERRFPYLDRSLLEFMYAIPREQIVRVGVRRSLMKRALVGIVPDELLNRKRKACTTTKLPKNRTTEWPSFIDIGQCLVSSSLGIIDQNRFWDALQRSRYSEEVPIRHMKQTLTLEAWLHHLTAQGVLANSLPAAGQRYSSPIEAKEF